MLVLNRADGSVLSRSLASCSANSPEEIVQEPQHCLLRIVHSLKHCCRQEQEVSLLPLQGLSWQEHCQAPELAAAARACWYQALFGGRSAVPLAASLKPPQLPLPSLLTLAEFTSTRRVCPSRRRCSTNRAQREEEGHSSPAIFPPAQNPTLPQPQCR